MDRDWDTHAVTGDQSCDIACPFRWFRSRTRSLLPAVAMATQVGVACRPRVNLLSFSAVNARNDGALPAARRPVDSYALCDRGDCDRRQAGCSRRDALAAFSSAQLLCVSFTVRVRTSCQLYCMLLPLSLLKYGIFVSDKKIQCPTMYSEKHHGA